MSLLTPLFITSAVGLTGIARFKDRVTEWRNLDRGFSRVEPYWGKLSLWAIIFSLALGTLAFFQPGGNQFSALIVSLLALFGVVSAFSDSIVRRVPKEINNYMVIIGLIVFLLAPLASNKTMINEALRVDTFFPRVPTDSLLPIVLYSLLTLGVAFLIYLKIPSEMFATVFLAISQISLFLAVYAPLLWVAYSGEVSPYWSDTAKIWLLPFTAVGVVWFFAWMVGDQIGGADILFMYFTAMTLPFLIGPGMTLWTIMLAMPLQLIVHIIGSKMGIGELKTLKNKPMSQTFENILAKIQKREPRTHRQRRAIAFMPVLAFTVIVSAVGTGIVF